MRYQEHNIIDRAREYCMTAHQGQTRSDNLTPFHEHPFKTAEILATVTDDPNLIAAGYLHDTIEDTDITYWDLVDDFNEDVAHLVFSVTKEDDDSYPRLNPDDRRAIMLKFADRLSNISDMNGWSEKKRKRYLAVSRFWKKG